MGEYGMIHQVPLLGWDIPALIDLETDEKFNFLTAVVSTCSWLKDMCSKLGAVASALKNESSREATMPHLIKNRISEICGNFCANEEDYDKIWSIGNSGCVNLNSPDEQTDTRTDIQHDMIGSASLLMFLSIEARSPKVNITRGAHIARFKECYSERSDEILAQTMTEAGSLYAPTQTGDDSIKGLWFPMLCKLRESFNFSASNPYEQILSCNWCGKATAVIRCPECFDVAYCGEGHEKADRERHRQVCNGRMHGVEYN